MSRIALNPEDRNPQSVELVTLNQGAPATTSLAMAEGTGVEHRAVLQLVRSHQADFEEFGQVAFQMRSGYNNCSVEIAILNEDQATLLITYMKNSAVVREFKKRLIKAFRALKDHVKTLPANPANLSRLQLLSMAMEAEQERLALDNRVQVLAPKAEALDRIATTTEGTHTITDSAKLLQQLPKKFFNFLQVEGWIYRQNGRWIAYQDKINQRLMEHKFCNVQHAHGTEFDVAQPMITPKGLAKLSLSLNPAPKQPRLLMGE